MIRKERLRLALESVDDAILASLPEPEQCEHIFSADFEKKMHRAFRRAAHPVARKVLYRAACVLLALTLLLGSLVAFHPIIRATVIDWFREWVDGFYKYSYVGQEPAGQGRSIRRTDYELSRLPEGYTLLWSLRSDYQGTVVYTNEDRILRFNYLSGTDQSPLLNREHNGQYHCVFVGDLPAEIYEPGDNLLNRCIIWTDPETGTIFCISADCSDEELIWLAEGVVQTECMLRNNGNA